jgi:hypothetical protein
MTLVSDQGANRGNGTAKGAGALRPYVRIETIKPKKAEEILDEQNVHNRSLRSSRVTHLAAILKRGEWKLTGDAIVFDEDGVLLNGQHRLAACGVAGIPIEVVVLRNLPRVNQDVMDDTLSRRLGDALTLRGETDPHPLGSGINWYARLLYAEQTGLVFFQSDALRPSIPQLLTLYDANPGLREALVQTRPLWKLLRLRPGPSVAVRYRLNLIDPKDAAAFFDKLRTGADIPAGSALLALRRYIDNERDRTRSNRGGPDFKWVAVTIKAWNAWREDRPVTVLSYSYSSTHKEGWPIPQ